MAMKVRGIKFENEDWEWLVEAASREPDVSASDLVRRAYREFRARKESTPE